MTVVNTQLHDKINQVVLVGDLIVHLEYCKEFDNLS